MTLQELADRTGIPLRKLRYVVDDDLIADLSLEVAENEAGRPRFFSDILAMEIAIAAQLSTAGLKRTAVRHFFWILMHHRPDYFWDILRKALAGGPEVLAEFGDGSFVRIKIGAKDLGWKSLPERPGAAKDCNPSVIVALNLSRLALKIMK